MDIKLNTPLTREDTSKLNAGDYVYLSGTIYTARDAAHKLMVEERPDFIREYLKDAVIYHCGPVVKQDAKGEWSFVSAGPTTSSREEPYQSTVIGEYGVRAVIGKGGMGPKTLAGLKEHGAVYLHAIGGSGSLTASPLFNSARNNSIDSFDCPRVVFFIFFTSNPQAL